MNFVSSQKFSTIYSNLQSMTVTNILMVATIGTTVTDIDVPTDDVHYTWYMPNWHSYVMSMVA